MIKGFFAGKANKPIIGLVVAALVVGGISAQASGVLNTPSGGYLLCVNSKTKVITHPGTTNCPKGSKKLTIGASGKDGKTLWNGEKDPENTLGSPGDIFINSVTKTLFGPKNLDGTWPAGVSMIGPTGATGPQGPGGGGPAGPAGATGASGVKITELSVCDGPDAGTVANELCKIGMTGPGSGKIFFVDYYDQYVGFDYLEAAPKSCEPLDATDWSSDISALVTGADMWAGRAVGKGQINTTAIMAAVNASTIANAPAAAYADGLTCGGKSDWFLGSLGEMKLMCDNLQGDAELLAGPYWSSSELDWGHLVWVQHFDSGTQDDYDKAAGRAFVRPVRSF